MGRARGMATKGKKRSRNGLPPAAKAVAVAGDEKESPEKAGGGKGGPEKAGGGAGFFCCYLLRSLCPLSKSRTYIGYTPSRLAEKMSSLFLAPTQRNKRIRLTDGLVGRVAGSR